MIMLLLDIHTSHLCKKTASEFPIRLDLNLDLKSHYLYIIIILSIYQTAWLSRLICAIVDNITGVIQKVLPVLSTETLLHIWLSTEYYGFRPSSTAVDTGDTRGLMMSK